MAENMVERVARAIWETREGRFPPRVQQRFGEGEPWTHAATMAEARAAIAAMREPTDEQRNAYYRMRGTVMMDAEWNAMIDAALGEG
jgi:hypothetical protein